MTLTATGVLLLTFDAATAIAAIVVAALAARAS
jgi:hypothetical protein